MSLSSPVNSIKMNFRFCYIKIYIYMNKNNFSRNWDFLLHRGAGGREKILQDSYLFYTLLYQTVIYWVLTSSTTGRCARQQTLFVQSQGKHRYQGSGSRCYMKIQAVEWWMLCRQVTHSWTNLNGWFSSPDLPNLGLAMSGLQQILYLIFF